MIAPFEQPCEAFERQRWDAIVIGTGIGGSTLGFALARAGWRVLFLEKGCSHLNAAAALRGRFAEDFLSTLRPGDAELRGVLARSGRASESLLDASPKGAGRFTPFIGCGTGGSSALYGMAMERMRPSDLAAWPVSYPEMRPHYEAAERLYLVRGERDPLRAARSEYTSGRDLPPGPPLHPANAELKSRLEALGLHPYRLPLACDYLRGDDRSQGFLDKTGAKIDAAQACLHPAIEEYGAELLDECRVERLEADRTRVTEVHAMRRGRRMILRGRVVVLAAGALFSPWLLLRSSSVQWRGGLANGSGLVGRNLMRHWIDLYLVDAAKHDLRAGNLKELAFGDWCAGAVSRGSVQSFGELPDAEHLVAEMEEEIRQAAGKLPSMCVRAAAPLLRPALRKKLSRSLILASIVEDAPSLENRVFPDGDGGLAFRYSIGPHDRDAIRAFRKRMLDTLRPLCVTLLKQAENNRRIAHACGTCRFGERAAGSVADAFCRAHELDNLYIADASFFPTSSCANPSLTIAANALRVAGHLVDRAPQPVRRASRPAEMSEGARTQCV